MKGTAGEREKEREREAGENSIEKRAEKQSETERITHTQKYRGRETGEGGNARWHLQKNRDTSTLSHEEKDGRVRNREQTRGQIGYLKCHVLDAEVLQTPELGNSISASADLQSPLQACALGDAAAGDITN